MTRGISALNALALLREGIARLESAGSLTARQDAEWLLASTLGTDRFAVYLDPAREVTGEQAGRYEALTARRAAREPLQYLLGFEEFHGLRLTVTPAVLIPRPETEGLVSWAVDVLRDRPRARVADIGTGSGAIACALATAVPDAEVIAVECSPSALEVARDNARRLGLSGRITWLAGDLLEPLASARGALDLVVANAPYIPSALIRSLQPEVSAFEPRLALDGGPDGMAVLRRLIVGAPALLTPGGWLLMEIGDDQAGPVASLLAAEGFQGIRARHDLRGVERYIAGQWPPATPRPPSVSG